MKRLILLTAVVAWVLAMVPILVAAPVLAQEEAAEAADPSAAMIEVRGEPPRPDPPLFAFNRDGTVTIDGDQGASCFDFARDLEQEGFFPPGYEAQYGAQAQSVVEQCERGGFLSPDNQYVTYPPFQRQQPFVPEAHLPATGGPGLSAPGVPLAGGVLLVVLTVLGIVARRRTS